MLKNSEKRASDEVCNLSERVHRLQVVFSYVLKFCNITENTFQILAWVAGACMLSLYPRIRFTMNNMCMYFSCTCMVAIIEFYLYLCLGHFGHHSEYWGSARGTYSFATSFFIFMVSSCDSDITSSFYRRLEVLRGENRKLMRTKLRYYILWFVAHWGCWWKIGFSNITHVHTIFFCHSNYEICE